jgi:hypothetical protein
MQTGCKGHDAWFAFLDNGNHIGSRVAKCFPFLYVATAGIFFVL